MHKLPSWFHWDLRVTYWNHDVVRQKTLQQCFRTNDSSMVSKSETGHAQPEAETSPVRARLNGVSSRWRMLVHVLHDGKAVMA